MIRQQLMARDIIDQRVLSAFEKTPRERFVPPGLIKQAWSDNPLPIGFGQTISQPYIVAKMTSLLGLNGSERVLEIGTGCGYQTAILAWLAHTVISYEIISELHDLAKKNLEPFGFTNVELLCGDALSIEDSREEYDAIIAGAAPHEIPQILVKKLKIGGKMVIPVGQSMQELLKIQKTGNGIEIEKVCPVRFVPLVNTDGESV